MGKIIVKRVRGMKLWAKFALVTLCTLIVSVFMYEGWYKPIITEATLVQNTTAGTTTWTAPAGVTQIIVETWGGGGGGGGLSVATNAIRKGGGGAGGQYAKRVVTVIPGNGYSVVVGAAGTAGTTAGGTAGTGGDSTFNGTTVVAKGGAGGTGYTTSGGAAGAGSTTGGVGDIVYAGGSGSAGGLTATGGAGGGGAGSTGAGGSATGNTAGTGTTLNGGNGAAGRTTSGNGTAGVAAGGGGSAGVNITAVTTVRTGGAGAAGRVNISYVTIGAVTNNTMASGTGPTTMTINGTEFQSGASVTFSGTGVTAGASTFVSATQITVPVTVTADANPGTYNITVTNPNGMSTTGAGLFTVTDGTKPLVETFTVPTTSSSLTISGITLTATDNVAVTGYLINESATPPAAAAVNLPTAPTSYTAASEGAKTLYAWARDAAGNVNNVYTGQPCTITVPDTTAPTVNTFTVPAASNALTVTGITLAASDNNAVTGYLINESATPPDATVVTLPGPVTSYTAASGGAKTLYAWVRDAAGNVSAVYTGQPCTITVNMLMHSSNTLGDKYGTWGQNKNCTWCHSAEATDNVKKISQSINTPSGIRKVIFYRMTASFNNHTGVLGNDSRTYSGNGAAGSGNICEVCHRNTIYHQYSAKSFGHYDNKLCTACHQHSDGFRPQGHGVPYYAATGGGHPSTCGEATGCHANVNPAAAYPTAGTPPDCRACHVTDSPKTAASRCVSCHGDPENLIDALNGQPSGITSPNIAGSHAAHLSGFVLYTSSVAVTCVNCHNVGGSGGKADHGKGNRGLNAAVVNVNPVFAPHNPGAGLTCDTASCHADPYGTALVPSPPWGASVGCASCHTNGGTFTADGAPATGSHTAHSNLAGPGTGSNCANCHAGAVNNVSGGANHLDNNIDVINGYQANVTKHAAGNGYSSCSAASCHGNPYAAGTLATPVWGVTSGCAACHKGSGALVANGAPNTGSHAVHMGLAVAACNDCHEAAFAASYQSLNHDDGNIDVIGGYPANVAKHTANSGYSSCSAASCHASPYGTSSIPSPVWGVAAGCSTCHKDGGAFVVNGAPDTGSHSVHMGLIGSACNQCHDGALNGVSGGLSHPNGTVDVSGDYTASPVVKHTAVSYTGYCMSASCHASPYGAGPVNSPVWGVATGCSSCHTGAGAFTGNGAPATGSHAKHMVLPGVVCAECHSGAVSGVSGGNNHSNQFVNVSSGYTHSPVPRHPIGTYDGTCANQCHTDGNGLSVPSSKWGVAMNANCTGCHGGAANVTPASKILATGKHRSHINNYSTLGRGNNLKCAECHAKTTALASDIALSGSGHVNQYKDYSGVKAGGSANYSLADGVCSTVYCHSNGQPVPRYKNMTGSKAWAGTAKFNCSGCHGSESGATWSSDFGAPNYPNKYDGTIKTANSHERHNVLSGATDSRSCAKCHDNSVDASVAGKLRNYSTTHLNKSIDVSFGIFGAYSSSTRTCSTYCHSNVQAPGGAAAATQFAKPEWGNNGSMTCASCHKDIANLTESAENLELGSHRRHVAPFTNMTSGSIGAGYDCSICHGSSYSATTAETVTHANGTINVAFTGRKATGTTYSQGAGNLPGDTYGSCSTSKCHGRATQNWGISTTDRMCEKCHGSSRTAIATGKFKDTAGSDASPYSGTHASHLAGTHKLMAPMQCNQCHIVPSSLNSFGHMSTLPAPIVWGNLAARPSIIRGYTTATPIMTPTYSAGLRQCNNTYCHAGVQIKNPTTGVITFQGSKPNPTWADAGYLAGTGCNMCHGYPPGGQHPTSTICSGCHAHVDQSNLAFVQNDPINSIDVRNHLNGIINVTEDDCLGCHSSSGCTPAEELAGTCFSRELVGGHDTHTNSEMFLKNLNGENKKLSAGDYIDSTWIYGITFKKGFPQYACGFCHPMDVALHKNGVVEVDLDPTNAFRGSVKTKNLAALPTPPAGWYNTWLKTFIPGTVNASGGYVSGSIVCNNVYCHSTGYVSETTKNYQFKETPDWYYADSHGGVSAWAGQDSCAKCHGNSPNTNGNEGSSAHARHVVANHFKDVFAGYSAKLKYAGKPGSGAVHGDPATSTNFNCNMCHFDTVRVAYNDKGSVCIDCHASPRKASLLNYSAVAMGKMIVYSGSTKHVNGDVDVAFMEPFAVKSKAQIRDNLASVQSVYTSWTRVNGYKNTNSYDLARMKPEYVGGTCSTTACHNNTLMEWRTKGPLACSACHNGLPQ